MFAQIIIGLVMQIISNNSEELYNNVLFTIKRVIPFQMLLQEKVDALREEVEDLIKMPGSQDLEFNSKSYQSSKEKKTNSAQEAMFSENKSTTPEPSLEDIEAMMLS